MSLPSWAEVVNEMLTEGMGCRGDDRVVRSRSGPDEACDRIRGFLELRLSLGTADSYGIDHTVAEVLVQQAEGDRLQRLGHRRHLGEDVDAVLLLLNHPL